MGQTLYRKSIWCIVLIAGLMLLACSSGSYFVVRYQVPHAMTQMEGKTAYVTFNDMRSNKEFLSETARKDFAGFAGLYSLYMVEPNQPEELIGGFKVDSLFTKAFQKRLEAMGIKVLKTPGADTPTIELGLKEFYIDYRSRKWYTTVSYQAQLKAASGNTSTEGVSSSGERVKMLGTGNVEKYMGEIFSECLNKLDVVKLYQRAGL